MARPPKNSDPIAKMRREVQDAITKDYSTVEQFCWEHGLNKATLSNFLKNKKDFQSSSLIKIANALGKTLTIRLD